MTADDDDESHGDPGKCPYCKGTGVVINGDGRPGWRDPRICHHDRTWRPMTPPERAQLGELLGRLNRNPIRQRGGRDA